MKLYGTFLISVISLVLIAEILNSIGLFKWAVYTFLLASEGSCRRFFISILLFTVLISTAFNNVCVVLIFLPVLYEILRESNFNELIIQIFLFSCAIIADVSSSCFVNSSIVNLLYSDLLKISFNGYASKIMLSGIISSAVCIILLYSIYKKEIRCKFKTEKIKNPDDMITDWTLLNAGVIIMIIISLGYFLCSIFNINYSIVSLTGAIIFFIIYFSRNYKITELIKKSIIRSIFFITVLVVFIFNVINYANTSTLVSGILNTIFLNGALPVYLHGIILLVLSLAAGNIPISILGIFVIKIMNIASNAKEYIIYSSILCLNTCSVIFPIGSISMVLFFKFLKTKQIKIKFINYIKISLKVTIPALISGLLILRLFI